MSFGIRIANGSSELVVDETFLNYVFLAAGSMSITAGTAITAAPIVSFPALVTTASPPVIAANWPENNNVYCMGYRPVGNPGAWSGFQLYFVSLARSVTFTLAYQIFGQVPPGLAGWGVSVLGANGTTVNFSSFYSPMRVRGFILPTGWAAVSSTSPVAGVRRAVYNRPNPSAGAWMVIAMHRYGDLVYPDGDESKGPVALVSYGYGYGSGGTIRLFVIMQTFTSTTPSAPSTPNVYISPLV